jgi:hypothetical protein
MAPPGALHVTPRKRRVGKVGGDGDGTLLWLVGNAAAYLVLGILIFRWCERIAKRRGTLGQY